MKNPIKKIEYLMNFILMVYIFGCLIYSAFARTPIKNVIDWDWWMMLMMASIFTNIITGQYHKTK